MGSIPKKKKDKNCWSHNMHLVLLKSQLLGIQVQANSFNLIFCNRIRCQFFVSPLKIRVDKRVHHR